MLACLCGGIIELTATGGIALLTTALVKLYNAWTSKRSKTQSQN